MNPIEQLYERSPQTRSELGLSHYKVNRMVEQGELVRSPQTQKVEREGRPYRGRPRNLYRLSDRARKRIRRERV